MMIAVESISVESTISIAVLVIVVGAAWRLSAILTDIKAQLAKHEGTPQKVTEIGLDMSDMSHRLTDLEEDVNNLWAFARTEDPAELFKVLRRGPRSRRGEKP